MFVISPVNTVNSIHITAEDPITDNPALEKVGKTIKTDKNNKAERVNGVPAELIKYGETFTICENTHYWTLLR